MLLFLLSACRPEPAPAELEEVCGWIFAHFDEERERDLVGGVENLDDWMVEHEEEIGEEGYEVLQLSDEVPASLPSDRQHEVDGAVGAAVADPISHEVLPVATALLVEDQIQVFEGVYERYDRSFEGDPDCFLDGDCDRVEAENDFDSQYGGLIDVTTRMHAQYRWVELEQGPAFLQRTWLSGDTEVSVDWASVDEQYFLMVVLPRPDGVLRVQTVWIKARLGEDSAPESAALNVMVNSMRSQTEQLQAWLDR